MTVPTDRPAPARERPPGERPPGEPARELSAGEPAGERPLPPVLRRLADRVPIAAALLVLAGQFLLPHGWERAAWLPLSVALLVGLPHGAVDHLVPAWTLARRTSRPRLALLLLGYVAAGGAALAVLLAAPRPALLGFLLLSVAHFGTADVVYGRLRAPGRTPAPVLGVSALGVLAWGGVPVLLPLAVWTPAAAPVLDGLAPGTSALLIPAVRAAVAGLVLAAAAAWAALAVARGRVRPAAEMAVLVALFVLVPPLPAFAVYFGGWHALRHTVRLVALDPANAAGLAAGRAGRPLARFAAQALLPTLAALAVLAVLWSTAGTPLAFLTADLTLLAALTVPHMLLVAWLDRRTAAVPVAPGLSATTAR